MSWAQKIWQCRQALATGLAMLCWTGAGAAQTVNLSGDWEIHSSVGGGTPVMVYCSLLHEGDTLGGSCVPVMENPEPSELQGKVSGDTASWGYDVVFNGNPGRVDFTADSITTDRITGILSLSGTRAPFEALRQPGSVNLGSE